jgi:5-deoxy-glucuronate isomerase
MLNKDFRKGFDSGFTQITHEGDLEKDTGIDFGILKLRSQEMVSELSKKESVFVLLKGKAEIKWNGEKALVERHSLFDEEPTALHVPGGMEVKILSNTDSEWAVARTSNVQKFQPRFYRPQDIKPEYRGKGLAQGTCERNVRLVFDRATRPESNLVLGEVINYPGRWSSYPPHHHEQPEIYHYRFTLPQGYGHGEVGEDVYKIKSNDTIKIVGGMDHSQVAAPGYGMYYLWIVRHLPDNPYLGFEFTEEHRWILNPENQGWEARK